MTTTTTTISLDEEALVTDEEALATEAEGLDALAAEEAAQEATAELDADMMPAWLVDALGEELAREAWLDCPATQDGTRFGTAWVQALDELHTLTSGRMALLRARQEATEDVARLEQELAEGTLALSEARYAALGTAAHLADHALAWARERSLPHTQHQLGEALASITRDQRSEARRAEAAAEGLDALAAEEQLEQARREGRAQAVEEVLGVLTEALRQADDQADDRMYEAGARYWEGRARGVSLARSTVKQWAMAEGLS